MFCGRSITEVFGAQVMVHTIYQQSFQIIAIAGQVLLENIRKAENEVAAMGMIAEFLVQRKYEKAKDHLGEVAELEVEVAAAWDRYTTNIHA